MSQSVTVNGNTYLVPDPGDTYAWATGAQGLTALLLALGNTTLQLSGGTFTLTANVDFGSTYGALLKYLTSKTANPAAAGMVRMANADTVSWRNAANGADLPLAVTATNYLTFNSLPVTGNPQAIYKSSAAQSFASGSKAIINYGTSELDTDSAVTVGASWKFTVPTGKSGLYQVIAAAQWNSAVTTGSTTLELFKNGSVLRQMWAATGGTGILTMLGASTVNLSAGDYLDIRAVQNTGTVTLTNGVADNYVCIQRLVG